MSTQEAAKLSRDSLPILAAYESPVGELETRIVELFVEAFSIDRVGADDDFFDLGGDSVAGVSLAIQISQYIGREFRASLLVRYGTPRKIAALLLRARTPSLGASARPPIFIVHGMLGIMMPRPEFIAGLAPDQEIRVFELPGIRGERPPHTSIEALAADYVAQLQKEYPAGPVLLAGYCRGSYIAMEAAAQLAALGRPVLQMVLFDPQTDPDNLTRYFNGILRPALGKKYSRRWLSRHWINRQRKHLRHLLLAGRWTDGAQAGDFGHEGMRRMYERRYRKLMLAGRYGSRSHLGSEHRDFIWDAQAKLLAAYHQYLPRPFAGPATVFASERTMRNFEKESYLWRHLLPNRTLHALGDTHEEVIQAQAATGARLMQEVFDAALSRDGRLGDTS